MKVKLIGTIYPVKVSYAAGQDPEALAAESARARLASFGDASAVGMFSYPLTRDSAEVDVSYEVTTDVDTDDPVQAEFLAKFRFGIFLGNLGLGDNSTAVAFP